MHRYFAQINKGIVQRVIAAHTKEWCEQNLGGIWVETFMDDSNKNYAGIGYAYDEASGNFIAPKPYPSWELNEKKQWQPPVAVPEDLRGLTWSEKTRSMKAIAEVKAEMIDEIKV